MGKLVLLYDIWLKVVEPIDDIESLLCNSDPLRTMGAWAQRHQENIKNRSWVRGGRSGS